jgi:hypothetical protein
MRFNLAAPIVAGKAAAGFHIGRRYDDYAVDFADPRVVRYFEGFNLVREVNQNTGILRIDGFRPNEGPCIYFGPGTVRLVFTRSGLLGCIYVWQGYAGAYGQAKIGSSLSTISKTEPLEYDSGDEMYYRVDASGDFIAGLAIEAVEVDPAMHEITPICGMCVHDWSLFEWHRP